MLLSACQFRRRKERTVQAEALKQIHCDSHVNTPVKKHTKAINDGLWTTMIGSETNDELKEYVSNSKKCMNSIVPGILAIRSMRVMYEGGLLGKRKYTSVRNSSDDLNEPAEKRQNNEKAEILPGVEVPKILPYKTLMAFLKTIDIGDVIGLETLATTVCRICSWGVQATRTLFTQAGRPLSGSPHRN